MKDNKSYEYIVIGTGPGGAPVAKELAKAGKSVLMLERGAYHKKFLGFPFGLRLLDRFMLFARSQEGVIIERGITVGGSSMVYQSNVADPPKKLINAMGINFKPETDEIKAEIGVKVLPNRFFEFSKGITRTLEAAEKMGIPFKAQDKFIDPDRCKIGCDWCMLGCPQGARWTTREYVDEAIAYGADLLTLARVEKIILNDQKSRVIGVGLFDGRVIRCDNVILSAGGIGSPALLLRSGIKHLGSQDVGANFSMDPMNIILGYSKDSDGGMWGVQTFSHAIESLADSEGFLIGNCAALGTYMVNSTFRLESAMKTWYRAPMIKRGIGLFVKLSDEPYGQIHANEKTNKPFTEMDHKRVDRGTDISKEIMIKAGADPSSFSILKWAGGHPGGTIAMGKAVNRDFSTEIQGMYVCDGSLMPISPGVPPSLSIDGMSKLLGKILTGQVKAEERFLGKKGKKKPKK
ncbi:MAG: GMC family oxidoreductase [Thermodesulfobacteriota bacterium]|nr:GMC family oxidoreductase [Thermodesulfobacteriota bacterium]